MPKKYPSMQARLDAQVEYRPHPDFAMPCKLWIGAVCGRGYGKVAIRSRFRYPKGHKYAGHRMMKCVGAHRLALALFMELPVWRMNHVMHRCDNRRCIEPSHLRSTTQKQNMLDMVRKGRNRNKQTGKMDELHQSGEREAA